MSITRIPDWYDGSTVHVSPDSVMPSGVGAGNPTGTGRDIPIANRSELDDYLDGTTHGGPAAGDLVLMATGVNFGVKIYMDGVVGTPSNPIVFTCADSNNYWLSEGQADYKTTGSYASEQSLSMGRPGGSGASYVWIMLMHSRQVSHYNIRLSKVGDFDDNTAPCDHITISHCKTEMTGQEGITGHDASFITIQYCDISETAHRPASIDSGLGEGVYMGKGTGGESVTNGTHPTHDWVVQYNWFHDGGQTANGGTSGVRGGEAVDVKKGVFNVTVRKNRIERWAVWSQAAITCWVDKVTGVDDYYLFPAAQYPNIHVTQNWISHITQDLDNQYKEEGQGIQVGEDRGIWAYSNLIHDCRGAAISKHHQNISVGTLGPLAAVWNNTSWRNRLSSNYPEYEYHPNTQHFGNVGETSVADKKADAFRDFVDAGNRNFNLKVDSPLRIAYATPYAPSTEDLVGNIFTTEAGALAIDGGEPPPPGLEVAASGVANITGTTAGWYAFLNLPETEISTELRVEPSGTYAEVSPWTATTVFPGVFGYGQGGTLADLTPATTYRIRIRARKLSTGEQLSVVHQFTTSNEPPPPGERKSPHTKVS